MTFWKTTGTILVAGLLGGALGAGGAAIFDKDCDQPDFSNIATKADIDALGLATANISEDVITLQDEMFAEDRWEATAEVLATEELEDDDYEELYEFMTDSIDGLGLDIDDEDDIDRVIIEDITTTATNVDDEKATVTFELKVYYENEDGDNKHEHIIATAVIDDGEVEDLSFAEQ